MVGPESLFSLFASVCVCVCMYVCLALDNRHGQTIGCLVSLRSFVSREQVVPLSFSRKKKREVLSIPYAAIVEKTIPNNHSVSSTNSSSVLGLLV